MKIIIILIITISCFTTNLVMYLVKFSHPDLGLLIYFSKL